MYGRRVHAARLFFVRAIRMENPWTEVICQRVAPEFDRGAVLVAKQVPIQPDDTVDTLQPRALAAEHEVQIEALVAFVENRVIERRLETPLIRPEHEPILTDAKRAGRLLYPKG
jgi:folate-dependent phosphoribosylglycinamide formyltransferase PurN